MGPQSYDCGNVPGQIGSFNTDCGNASHDRHASMGPQSYDCGNEVAILSLRTHASLQWGRSRTTAEMYGIEATAGADKGCFNGAAVVRLRK